MTIFCFKLLFFSLFIWAQADDPYEKKIRDVCASASAAMTIFRATGDDPKVDDAWLPLGPAGFVLWYTTNDNYSCPALEGSPAFKVEDVVNELKRSPWVQRTIEIERENVRAYAEAAYRRRLANPKAIIDYTDDAEVERILSESNLQMNEARSKMKVQNCTPVFKENISGSYVSKPTIEVFSCGSCTAFPWAKIKDKSLEIFKRSVRDKPPSEFFYFTFFDFEKSCSHYTFIVPTVKNISTQPARSKKAGPKRSIK